MKNLLPILACCFTLLAPLARGGTEVDDKSAVASSESKTDAVPLDLFKIQQSYVFESDLNHGGSFGKQDEIQSEMEYGHRILLRGNTYLHLGFSYERYDFGSTSAPVPNHLQALAGVVGIDFMHGKDVGAFIQFRPGFYAQNDFGISSFDVPITVGRIFILQPDKLFLFAGAYASFLQGGSPVIPLLGVIWIPNNKVRLMGVLPEPKLIYSPTDKLNLWVRSTCRRFFSDRSERRDSADETQWHPGRFQRLSRGRGPDLRGREECETGFCRGLLVTAALRLPARGRNLSHRSFALRAAAIESGLLSCAIYPLQRSVEVR